MAEGTNKVMVIDALAQLTTEQQTTVVDIARKALSEGKEAIQYTVENKVSAPLRQESPPRAHVFHSIGGFVAYLSKYKTSNTVVFIDIDNQQMYTEPQQQVFTCKTAITITPAPDPTTATMVIAGESQTGEPRLICKKSGSDSGDPRQGSFITEDGKRIDTEPEEILKK